MSTFGKSSNTKYYRKHPNLRMFEDPTTVNYSAHSETEKKQFNQAFSKRMKKKKPTHASASSSSTATSDSDDDVLESTIRYKWKAPTGRIPKVRATPVILSIADTHKADQTKRYKPTTTKIRSSQVEMISIPDAGIAVSTPTTKFQFLSRGPLSLKLVTFPRNKELTPYLLPVIGEWRGLALDSETRLVTTRDFSRSITSKKGFSDITTRCPKDTISFCCKNQGSNTFNLVLFNCPKKTLDTFYKLLRKYCRWRNVDKKPIMFGDATKPLKPKRYIAKSSYLAIEKGQPIIPLQMACYDIIKVHLASGEVCYIPTSIMKEIEYSDEDDWGYDPSKVGKKGSDSDDDTWLDGTKVVDYGKRAAVVKKTVAILDSDSEDSSDDDDMGPPPQHVFVNSGPPPENIDEDSSDSESDED